MRQTREGPPDAKPVEPVVATSHTTDLVRRHAEDEARRAAAARQAAEDAARKAEAARPVRTQLTRQVGLVDGSFDVFVDLTDPSTKRRVFRVFGPSPFAPPPAVATQAYAAGAEAPLPGRAVATEA